MSSDPRRSILEQFDDKKSLYADFAQEMQALLDHILTVESINYLRPVAQRVKDRESLERKLARGSGDLYTRLEEVTDIAGLRIITYFEDDVDEVAKIIKRDLEVDWDNYVDKRVYTDPRQFGYASLHYVVSFKSDQGRPSGDVDYGDFEGLKAEIQIRSVLQHAWAEIEHDLGYKAESVPDQYVRRFSRLSGTFELADEEFVRLRKALREREKNVREALADSPDLVGIDKASLNAFLDTEQTLRELDERIARAAGGTVLTGHSYEDTTHVAQLVQQLKWVGVNNVQQLGKELEVRRSEIDAFAKAWATIRSTSTPFFAVGISITYLAYIMAVSTLDRKRLEEFLVETRVAIHSEKNKVAEQMIRAYGSIENDWQDH